MPAKLPSLKYVLGGPELKINVPSLIVTPATCKLTYVVTAAEALSTLVKYDTASGKISAKGGGGVKPGTYKISVSAKTPKGTAIDGSAYTLDMEIVQKKEVGGKSLITTISATAGVVGVASVSAGAASRIPGGARGPRRPIRISGSASTSTGPTRGGPVKTGPVKAEGGSGPGPKAGGDAKGPAQGGDGGKGPSKGEKVKTGETGGDAGTDSFDVESGEVDSFDGGDFGEEGGEDSTLSFEGVEDGVNDFDFSI